MGLAMLISEKWIKKKRLLKPSARSNLKKPITSKICTKRNSGIIPSVSPVVYPYKKKVFKNQWFQRLMPWNQIQLREVSQ